MNAAPSRLEGLRGRVHGRPTYRWWVLWTVLAGLLSVNITFTLFAVALERVAAELHTTTNGLTWVITLPLLAFGVAAPALGKLGDLHGHRRLYLIGIVGSIVAAALSALAPNVGTLIVVRTLGQILGAATGAASMALIFRVFPPEDRVKAMGFWSLVGAGGPVIGVVIGGPVIEAIGWRAMFWAQVPLCAAAGVLAFIVLPDFTPPVRGGRRPRLDLAGTASLSVAVTAFLLALNRGPELGWTSPLVLGGFVLVPVFLVAFKKAEERAAEPLLPLDLLRRRNFVFPMASQACVQFAYMGGFILAPQLLHEVYGFGESKTGLISIARPLAFSILAPVAGYLTIRVGERAAGMVGATIVGLSMVAFATLGAGAGVGIIILALALSGMGNGITSPAMAASVANAVDEEQLGVSGAALQLMTQVGLVAGIQLMKSIETSGSAGLAAGAGKLPAFATAYWLGAGACVVAVALAAFVVPARRTVVEAARTVIDHPPQAAQEAAAQEAAVLKV